MKGENLPSLLPQGWSREKGPDDLPFLRVQSSSCVSESSRPPSLSYVHRCEMQEEEEDEDWMSDDISVGLCSTARGAVLTESSLAAFPTTAVEEEQERGVAAASSKLDNLAGNHSCQRLHRLNSTASLRKGLSRDAAEPASMTRSEGARCTSAVSALEEGEAPPASLSDRQYVMERVFTRVDQQSRILLFKLNDAFRHAMSQKAHLLSVFRHYICPILEFCGNSVSTAREARYFLQLEQMLLHPHSRRAGHMCTAMEEGGALRHFYPACLSEAGAPEESLQLMAREWHGLMDRVKASLASCEKFPNGHPDDAEEVEEEAEGPHSGQADRMALEEESLLRQRLWLTSVMMQSMELFERYYPLQAAVREAEDWVMWYYDPQGFAEWDVQRRRRDAETESVMPLASQKAAERHASTPQPDGVAASSSQCPTPQPRRSSGAACEEEEYVSGLGSPGETRSPSSESEQSARTPAPPAEDIEDEATEEALSPLAHAPSVDAGPPQPLCTTSCKETGVEHLMRQLQQIPFPRLPMCWEPDRFSTDRQMVEMMRLQRKVTVMNTANEILRREKGREERGENRRDEPSSRVEWE